MHESLRAAEACRCEAIDDWRVVIFAPTPSSEPSCT